MWCNAAKTKKMVITTRQKHQLSDLSLRLSVDGQNIENITEHHLLGLMGDNKCRWQAQIDHIITQDRVKKQLFLRSQLQYISIDTRKLFHNGHINLTSTMRQYCSMIVAKYIKK